jgi:hypothetical protein
MKDVKRYIRKNKHSVELASAHANDHSEILLSSIPMTFANGFITPWIFRYLANTYTSLFAPEWCLYSPEEGYIFVDFALERATPEGVEENMAALKWHQSRPLGCTQLHSQMRKAWFTDIHVQFFRG